MLVFEAVPDHRMPQRATAPIAAELIGVAIQEERFLCGRGKSRRHSENTPLVYHLFSNARINWHYRGLSGKGTFWHMADIAFIDNPVIRGREKQYAEIVIDCRKILESWRASLFSYEWLLPDGRIRAAGELSETEQPKRTAVEDRLKKGTPIEKPVLGIGLLENVEIGSGRATFLTLAARGLKTMPVHVPKSNLDEFNPFLARAGESGNVMFYILLAIALLAALTFAVAGNERTSAHNLTADKIRLYATDIIDYGHALSNATAQLRLRGIRDMNISFESPLTAANNYINPNCTTDDCRIFAPDGGGVIWTLLDAAALDTTHTGAPDYAWWSISGAYDITSVGSNCAGSNCKDVAAFANNINVDVCKEINRLLGIVNIGNAPPVSSISLDPMGGHFKGTYPNTADTLDGATAAAKETLHNHTAACVKHDTPADPTYIYYQVLMPR